MKCREAEKLIQAYIEDKLSPKKLEAFISHVSECPSCYEELEIYFIIHYAIKYLDEDRQDSYDMKAMLSEDLKEKEKRIKVNNRMKLAAVYIGILFVIALLAFLSILLSPDATVTNLFHTITI